MANLGTAALWLALLSAGYACIGGLLPGRWPHLKLDKSVRYAMWAAFGATLLGSGLLVYALLSHNFQIRYVYEHISTTQPWLYTLSAFWAGQEGSLLLWMLAVSAIGAILAKRPEYTEPDEPEQGRTFRLTIWSVAAGMVTFLAVALIGFSNPFARSMVLSEEGTGLNPLLQNWAMIAHPPLIFGGYAAYVVPFAYAVAAWITRRSDGAWLGEMRRWSLIAWALLGAGMLLGAWWAYVELGWGGYWSWDPVENASLVPWLTGAALLHALLAQKRRGIFRGWTTFLSTLTFLLCLVASFITRSGMLRSVHAFAASSIGFYFLIGIGGVLLAMTVAAVVRHLRKAPPSLPTAVDDDQVESVQTKEAAFLLTHILLVGTAAAVLIGTFFPFLSEWLSGQVRVLQTHFFERTVGPLMACVLVLMGLCSALPWRSCDGRRLGKRLILPLVATVAAAIPLAVTGVPVGPLVGFGIAIFASVSALQVMIGEGMAYLRRSESRDIRTIGQFLSHKRRKLGAHLVHLSIALIATGIIGSLAFQTEHEIALKISERTTVGRYELVYEGVSALDEAERGRLIGTLSAYRDTKRVTVLRPEIGYYWISGQRATEVAVHSTPVEDLYVALVDWDMEDGTAFFRLWINPLVMWLWIGGGLMLFGVIWTAWPERRHDRD